MLVGVILVSLSSLAERADSQFGGELRSMPDRPACHSLQDPEITKVGCAAWTNPLACQDHRALKQGRGQGSPPFSDEVRDSNITSSPSVAGPS